MSMTVFLGSIKGCPIRRFSYLSTCCKSIVREPVIQQYNYLFIVYFEWLGKVWNNKLHTFVAAPNHLGAAVGKLCSWWFVPLTETAWRGGHRVKSEQQLAPTHKWTKFLFQDKCNVFHGNCGGVRNESLAWRLCSSSRHPADFQTMGCCLHT